MGAGVTYNKRPEIIYCTSSLDEREVGCEESVVSKSMTFSSMMEDDDEFFDSVRARQVYEEQRMASRDEYEEELKTTARFRKVMEDRESRRNYRAFLRTEFASENLDFYQAVENLKKLTSDASVRRAFQVIFIGFILKSSSKSISISDRLFNKLAGLNDDWNATRTQDIFRLVNEAQNEVSLMLYMGSFLRFENVISQQ
jgi:hypothetical protein